MSDGPDRGLRLRGSVAEVLAEVLDDLRRVVDDSERGHRAQDGGLGAVAAGGGRQRRCIVEIQSAVNADLVAQAAHHAACGSEGPFSVDGCGADVAAGAVDQGDDHLVAAVLVTPPLLLLNPRLVDLDLCHLEEAARLDGLLIVEIHSALNADLVAQQAAHHAASGSEGPFSVNTRGCVVDVAAVVLDQGDELVILVLPPVLLLILLLLVLLDPQLLDLHHLEDVPQAGAACGSGCTAGQQSMHAEVVPADGRLQHEAKHGH